MLRRILSLLLIVIVLAGTAEAVLASRREGDGTDPPPTLAPRVPLLSIRRMPDFAIGVLARERVAAVIDPTLSAPDLAGPLSNSCLAVRIAGGVAYGRNTAIPIIPASTMKTFTAATVLAFARPDEHFTTSVRASAAVKDGVLDGDLWLVGGGDPLLATDDYLLTFSRQPQIATPIGALADRVVSAGIKRVTGAVVGDDRRFDGQRAISTWKRGYLTTGQVGPLSALSVNDGFTDGTGASRKASSNPPAGAAKLFASLLADRGVRIDRPARASAAEETVPPPAQEVAAIDSPPIAQVIAEMLQESDNTTAELMLKDAGLRAEGDGSTLAGLRAEQKVLSAARLPLDGFVANDGSGLDRQDRATCALLLANMASQPMTGPLVAGLAVAGEVGTLRKRMKGTGLSGNVRAKTGTLNGVSALVGLLKARSGTRIDFAMVFNNLSSSGIGVQLEDKILGLLYTLELPREDIIDP